MKIEITTNPLLSCLHNAGKFTSSYFKYVEKTAVFIKREDFFNREGGAYIAKNKQVINLPFQYLFSNFCYL